MFHWLKHVGGSIEEAYRYFEQYEGMKSHLELQLDEPTTMQREDDEYNGSEWSHMSDYDAMGMAPNAEDQRESGEGVFGVRSGRGDDSYTPMKFLHAVRYTFGKTNKRYFDQVHDILADDPGLGGDSDSEV